MVEQLPTILEWHFYIHLPRLELYAESNPVVHDASGTCGYGAYLDGAWFGGICPHQCLKSWQSSRRSPETPPPQSCSPFNIHPYKAGIRKYYAFCHNFNLTTLHAKESSTPSTFLLGISVKRGVRKDRLWER